MQIPQIQFHHPSLCARALPPPAPLSLAMPDTRRGPTASDLQRQRASHSHGRAHSDKGQRCPNRSWGNALVAPDTCPGEYFTFDRAESVQCVKYRQYYVPDASEEAGYFVPLIARAVLKAAALPSPPYPDLDESRVLQAMARDLQADNGEQLLKVRSIEYGQLHPISNPVLSARAPEAQDCEYVPDEWDMYTSVPASGKGIKHMVQAPADAGGKHYEVTNMRSWPNNMIIIADVLLQSLKEDSVGSSSTGTVYAVKLYQGKRGRVNQLDPNTMHINDYCLFLEVGEWHSSLQKFVRWPLSSTVPILVFVDEPLQQALFCQYVKRQSNWRPAQPENADNILLSPDELQAMLGGSNHEASNRCLMEEKNGCMAYLQAGKGESEWIKVCNFVLHKFAGVYQFIEKDAAKPYFKIVCRRVLDHTKDDILYLAADAHNRNPDVSQIYALDIEVMVQTFSLKSSSDVDEVFQTHHASLMISIMTPEMLRTWIANQLQPTVTDCIVRFGKQPNDMFVAGNMTYGKKRMLTHKQSNVCIVPEFFSSSLLPLPRSDYPYHIIIPQCHVRFMIGMKFWNFIMPDFFINNLLPAKAVFAMGVMGLYADRLWKGESGCSHGTPFAWIYSTEPNTGKTEALLAVNSMLGFHRRSPWAGDASKSALMERVAQQSNLTVTVDDVVISNGESKLFQQFGRAIYDRSTRAVTGKVRTPYSSAMFTANTLCNEFDKAFQSRMILILFNALDENCDMKDPQLFSNWMTSRELMSALCPDLTTLLHEDKLDREAILDIVTFFETVTKRKRERNSNMWAILFYFMLQLNMLFQGSVEDQTELCQWIVAAMTRVSYELTNHASLLEQFVLAIHQVKQLRSSPLGREEETVFHHNFRTKVSPFANVFHSIRIETYYAVRVDSILGVIKRVLNKTFSMQEIYRLAQSTAWTKVGRCEFYDLGRNPWPIAIAHRDEVNFSTTLLPLMEEELVEEQLAHMRCIYLMTSKYDEIVQAVESETPHVPFEKIMINSAKQGVGEYNFFNAVTGTEGEGWFGYRALENCSFSQYLGMRNMLNVGSSITETQIVNDVADLNRQAGFGEIKALYQPMRLREFYDYNFPNNDALPPGLTMCPFTARNDRGDDMIFYERPPWYDSEMITPEIDEQLHRLSQAEVNEQSKATPARPRNCENAGSTPLRENTSSKERYNQYSSGAGQRKKKRRKHAFLADTADASTDDDNSTDFEITSQDLNFIDDTLQEESETIDYIGKCRNVIFEDENGKEEYCNEPCNPNEQLCHNCRHMVF